MPTSTYDWSFFDVYMDIRTPIDIVYDAWATSGGMGSFFVRTWRTSRLSGEDPRFRFFVLQHLTQHGYRRISGLCQLLEGLHPDLPSAVVQRPHVPL